MGRIAWSYVTGWPFGKRHRGGGHQQAIGLTHFDNAYMQSDVRSVVRYALQGKLRNYSPNLTW